MNKIAFLTAVLVSAAAFADEAKPKMMMGPDGKPAPVHYVKKGEMERAIYKHQGGRVIVPNSQKGKIAIVNCQKTAPAKWIEQSANAFAAFTKYNVKVEDGAFELPMPKVSGEASLFIVEDEKLPSVLLAPENRWAMINVAPLKTGEGTKEKFLAARIQKEMARGLALLCGAQDSQYPNSLMGCIVKPEDLDQFIDCRLPVDIMGRIAKYPAKYGILPAKEVFYRKACQEGWAPAPTNDIQKAIWDKAHQIPTKPIKIEYDEKRDKGK